MWLLCSLIGLASSALIIWQDVKSRKINHWLLFLFGLCGMGWQILYEPVLGWIHISFSVALVLAVLLVIGVWAYIVGKQEWLDDRLGLSDIFMLIGIACWFSPEHLLIFYGISIALIFVSANLLVSYDVLKKGKKVPLAAFLAVFFIADLLWHLL